MEAVDRFRAPKLTAAILEWKVRGDIGDDFDKMWFDFINEHPDFAKMIAISACIQERQDKGGLISKSFQKLTHKLIQKSTQNIYKYFSEIRKKHHPKSSTLKVSKSQKHFFLKLRCPKKNKTKFCPSFIGQYLV